MIPTTSTTISPTQMEVNFTEAVNAWSHTIIHDDSAETIQVAQEIIKKIWLKDTHSKSLDWSSATKGAPLAIKFALVQIAHNNECLIFDHISSLWQSLSDANKKLAYPKISQWAQRALEDLTTKESIYNFYLESFSETFLEFLDRGWVKDIAESNKKKELYRYILIGISRSGNQDGINKVLKIDKNINYDPLYFALRNGDYDDIKKLLDRGFQVTDFKSMLLLPEQFGDDRMIELLDIIYVGKTIPDDFLRCFLEERSTMSVRLIRWFVDRGNSLDDTLLGPYVAVASPDIQIPLSNLHMARCVFPWKNDNKDDCINRMLNDKYIVKETKPQIVDILLYAGCNPYEKDQYGEFPLEAILGWEKEDIAMDILKVFCKHQYDFKRPLTNGKSLLHQIEDKTHIISYEIMRFLIMEIGYPLGPIYEGGPSIIHLFSHFNEILEYCLEHGETFCEKDGTFKHTKPESAFDRLYDLGKKPIESLTGQTAGRALYKEIINGNKERILYILEHCNPILYIQDGGYLINYVKDLTLIDPLLELFTRQQIVCKPNLPEIFEKNGYVFYKTIADKFSHEEKVKILSYESKWNPYDTPAGGYFREKIDKLEWNQFITDISKISAKYLVHLLDALFEKAKHQHEIATWILLNPKVFNFPKCIKMLVANLILYRPSNHVIDLLKKAMALAKKTENGRQEIQKAMHWFAIEGSSANLSEEEYDSILSCIELGENQEWPVKSFYECQKTWPRRPFWNAVRKAFNRIPDFSNPNNKGITVLHKICLSVRSFGSSWKDQQPQSESEWNECKAVLKEMIQYACERGACKHLEAYYCFKRQSPLHMFIDSRLEKIPGEHPNFDEIARMVFIDVMEYGAISPNETPLHTACHIGWLSLFRELIKKGHSLDALDKYGNSVYDIISQNGDLRVAKAFLIDQKNRGID